MEKFMKPFDKEFMKMAMLEHEETFREQVYELHRLYRIQKMLMKSVPQSKEKGQNQETYINYQNGSLRHHQKINTQNNVYIDQTAAKDVEEDGGLEIEDEDEIELTLAPSSFQRRRSKSDNSNSALSISSSSGGSSQIKRGRNNDNSDLIGKQMRKDRVNQHPPWLYQVLSLNMT